MSKTITHKRLLYVASVVTFTALSLFLVGNSDAWAQSGSKTRSTQSSSGTTIHSVQSSVAMEGYCPVCVVDMKKWVLGTSDHQTRYDGKTYYFPSEKQKELFLANPAKYVPALGGDCTVCYAKMGKRMPGNIRNVAFHNQRLFLFPNADLKNEFLVQPDQYARVDLALDGKCTVCRIEMNQDVPGKPEIAVVHQGFRYLFPSEEQRKMFLANPAKYAIKPMATTQGSGTTAG